VSESRLDDRLVAEAIVRLRPHAKTNAIVVEMRGFRAKRDSGPRGAGPPLHGKREPPGERHGSLAHVCRGCRALNASMVELCGAPPDQ
jgi:hypothetical protein